MEKELTLAQERWEDESKLNKETVTEDNVADVVFHDERIPVNRIAQTESNKLAELPSSLRRT